MIPFDDPFSQNFPPLYHISGGFALTKAPQKENELRLSFLWTTKRFRRSCQLDESRRWFKVQYKWRGLCFCNLMPKSISFVDPYRHESATKLEGGVESTGDRPTVFVFDKQSVIKFGMRLSHRIERANEVEQQARTHGLFVLSDLEMPR